jgi:secreted PhoX family phosphatase
MLSRRRLITATATGVAFAGLARAVQAQRLTHAAVASDPYLSEVPAYGPLRSDPFGLFDLPDGFSYTAFSRAGQPMRDGLMTPFKMDGMGCFAAGRDRVALVRNHELSLPDIDRSAFGVGHGLADKVDPNLVFDRTAEGRSLAGGTTTLVYDLRQRRLVSDHLSLIGTSTNCAGGVTPWGSWLTCEEVATTAGGAKLHGWVFEVPAAQRGVVEPVPIKAMGRFKHEAVCIDPRTGVVYLTEDEGDSLVYRYLPEDRRNLAKGGRLQALKIEGAPDSRNWSTIAWAPGDWRNVSWIDVDGVESPDGDLRKRGASKGATLFARGEGIHFGDGELYLTCTSGGSGRLGQILRYRPSRFEGGADEASEPGRLQLFVETNDKRVMSMCDNLTVAPWGHLIVCEDKSEPNGVNYLKGVTAEGKVYTLGRQAQIGAGDAAGNTELAGACFSPDGTTLFVNAYFPGTTFAITGPWSRFRNA